MSLSGQQRRNARGVDDKIGQIGADCELLSVLVTNVGIAGR